jgi:lipopolysaccharide transport system ATP-binding protein
MDFSDLAIRCENISKCYRIGRKEEIQDSITYAVLNFIKSPLTNYRKYRSLYNFNDLTPDYDDDTSNSAAGVIWALRDVSFEVKRGEVLGIIGRNGAGKSTLLKILSSITDPTTGRAEIRGRVSSLLEVGTGFHPELTGRENIYLNGTVLGMRKREVDRKFQDIAEFSGVEKFLDTPVKRYSSGMTVRLAFSVAAHLDPDILIIDEVLAVGDADFQKKCLSKMEDVGQQGKTVLFVSHNMSAVTRLCNRAILLDEGRIIEAGPAHQLVSTYLSSDLGTTAARQWSDPAKMPGGNVARLRAVRIRAKDGRFSESVDIRDGFKIEMEYDVLKPGYALLPHFVLRNEKDQTVFVTVDQDPAWRSVPRPTGKYLSAAWVPGNFLAEGILFVNCNLLRLYPDELLFSEKSVIVFQVVDTLDGDSARGDYAKEFPGVVRPLLKWTTQFEPDRKESDSRIDYK